MKYYWPPLFLRRNVGQVCKALPYTLPVVRLSTNSSLYPRELVVNWPAVLDGLRRSGVECSLGQVVYAAQITGALSRTYTEHHP